MVSRLISWALAAMCFGFIAPLAQAATDAPVKGVDPIEISHGAKVKLKKFLVPGKTTVFDFYSTYCPVCMELKPGVEKLHHTRDDVAIVFVDINRPGFKGIDWDSPVSKQYDLSSTPQFKVYGPDCVLRVEGKPAYDLVTSWMK